jgi:copper homeostasis protein
MKDFKLELCCENVQQAIQSSNYVDQIEFCANLDQDGLTPNLSDVLALKNNCNTLIKVMIRHRGGDFIYNNNEFELMLDQATEFIKIGIKHFIFGALNNHGRLNIDQISLFAAHVHPSMVCIHKAIDQSSDILSDVAQLLKIENVNEILSSGGRNTALEGHKMLRKMVVLAHRRIEIIAAGKITYQNIESIHDLVQTNIYHGRRIIETINEI